jgi:3-oxoacyl-[acyl-carrier protein] reductase
MSSFDGRCAVVTGSASGLGAAAAIALTRGCARVIINYRSITREVEETADICRAANAPVMVVQADVANDADCRKLAATPSEWSQLDVLINNASATKPVANPANLDALSGEDVQRLYGITGSARSMARAARSLLERPRPRLSVAPSAICFPNSRGER